MIKPTDLLSPLPTWQGVIRRLATTRPGGRLAADGLWGAALSLFLAGLASHHPLLILVPDDEAGEDIRDDLQLFGIPERDTALLPTLDYNEDNRPDPGAFRDRLIALGEIRRGIRLLIIPLPALSQPLPPLSLIAANRIMIRTGADADLEEITTRAVAAGFRRVPLVTTPGEISLRGDILDIFPFSERTPLRLETLDGEVESLRTFAPESQRSLTTCKETEILLVPKGSLLADDEEGDLSTWLTSFATDRVLARVEPALLEERARTLATTGTREQALLQAAKNAFKLFPNLSLQSLPTGEEFSFSVAQIPPPAPADEGAARLAELAAAQSLVVCSSPAEQDRLQQRLTDKLPNGTRITTGRLSKGFRWADLGLTALSHDELEGLRPLPRPRRPIDIPARAIKGFYELRRGDLVVHASNGIARFLGIRPITKGDAQEDHLELLFADDVTLYVPVSRIELIQKFVGHSSGAPPLDRLGSKSFGNRKEKVRKALLDMAAELLEIQAIRNQAEGLSCPGDDEIQRSFEADFPFKETPDQLKVMAEIRQDLLASRPMDRMVCGDVGFGKTELAMRAAFKVVLAGRQVAMLVPTTILAQQHYETFRARMADWPVTVGVLSRFRTQKEQTRVIKATAAGKVDILIGTHRLLSTDVTFKDLGLVIVDEEQRFGVAHKEKLKAVRALVDLLTLTATPIPRTLHLSLVGLRDISSLTTPPTGRQQIATLLRPRTEELIQEGIRRELLRGGQVFFLHNRVHSIERVHQEIQALVPEARTVIGHGQMPERQLEKAMLQFSSGEVDVLISTSIIESGLDIPKANTIFIDRADRFGLADLHQLRGRVGRYKHKAFAYLLYDAHNPPRGDAALRLKALEELSGLGAGFAIAMRDLEIRGSGNILGAQQSGHIAAVGYDMYCRLLQAATAALQGEAPPPIQIDIELFMSIDAMIPPTYITQEDLRIEALRIMEEAARTEDSSRGLGDLQDRYGKPPVQVCNLARIYYVRYRLISEKVKGLRFEAPDRYIVRHPAGRPPRGPWIEVFAAARFVKADETHLVLPESDRSPERALALLENALGISY